MTYGGESNAKRVARFHLWADVLMFNDGVLSLDEGRKSPEGSIRVLALAGPEAADARCLRGLGVYPSEVTLADMDLDAICASRKVMPDANYFHGDVFEYLMRREHHRAFDVVFLDMCSPISKSLTRKIARAAMHAVNNNGRLAVGVMMGRETGRSRERTIDCREKVGQLFAAMSAKIQTMGRETAIKFLRAKLLRADREEDNLAKEKLEGMGLSAEELVDLLLDPDGHDEYVKCLDAPKELHEARQLTLKQSLRSHTRPQRVELHEGLAVFYHSAREGNRGVPMLYASYILRRYRKRNVMRKAIQRHRGYPRVLTLGKDVDGAQVKEAALALAAGGCGSARAADIFNLKRQQIAAWKAWETMRQRKEQHVPE
jgi:hypothetical protein